VEDDGLVEITTEEAAAWAALHGSIFMLTKPDGRRYRVIDPWETGRAPEPPFKRVSDMWPLVAYQKD
jgi:hypothetical protein